MQTIQFMDEPNVAFLLEDNFIAIPYKSENQDELKFILEISDLADSGNSNYVSKKNKKEKKKLETKSEHIHLELSKFNTPYFLNEKYFQFKQYCIFYVDLNKIDWQYKNIKLIQECDRKFGKSVYYADHFATNDKLEKYLFDLKFRKNDEYKVWKKPNGDPIDSNTDKLLLIFSFLWQEKSNNLFKNLDQLIYEFELKMKKLTTSYEIQKLVEFIQIFHQSEQYFKVKTDRNTNIICVSCLLGFLHFNSFNDYNLEGECLSPKFVKDLIDIIEKRNGINKIEDYKNLVNYFNDGLLFVFYACLKTRYLMIFLVPFLTSLVKFDIEIFKLCVKNMMKNTYFIKIEEFNSELDLIRTQTISIDNEEEKKAVVSTFINLCPSMDGLFQFVKIFCKESIFKMIISDNADVLKERFFLVGENPYKIDLIRCFEKFKQNETILHDLRIEFFIYFIRVNLDFEYTIQKVLELNEKTEILWTKFLEEIIERAKELNIKSLLNIINLIGDINLDFVKNVKQEIREVVKVKVSKFQPPFLANEKTIISDVLSEVLSRQRYFKREYYFT